MKTSTSVFERLGCFTLLTIVTFAPALAQAEQSGDWEYFAGGYLTTMAIDATTSSPGPTGDTVIDIDADFSDILDNLDWAASGIFIARKGPLSLNVDLVLVELEIDEATPLPATSATIDVGIREYEFFVGYAAFDSQPDLEIIAGARYIDQDITVNITSPLLPVPTLNIGDDWIDPFIGLRYLGPINNKWAWLLRGDIGGFGVGSDFAWRVDAGVTYDFAKQWEAAIWYKTLDIDYETGTSGTTDIYTWDGTESGITLGVGYYF